MQPRPSENQSDGLCESRGDGRCRWFAWAYVQGTGLWLAVGLPLILVGCAVLLPGVPDVLPCGDDAVIELFTWHTLDGVQLEGIRCRDDGVQHLGPIYFYVLAPLYWLSGCRYHGLTVTNVLLNLAAIGGALLVTWRCAGRASAVWATLLLVFYTRFVSTAWLTQVWTPWIVILPFVVTMFLLAAVAAGRLWYLPAAAASCSFIVQTQMGYSLTLAGIALVAVALGVAPGLRGLLGIDSRTVGRDEIPSPWRPILVTCAVSAVLWTPPIIKQLSGQPGNLAETIRFFAQSGACHSWSETCKSLTLTLAAFPLSLAGIDLKPALDAFETRPAAAEFPLWYGTVAIVPVLLLPIAYWLARRRSRNFEATLSLLSVVALVACIVSVRHIVGPIARHYVFWMSSLSLLSLFVAGSALLGPLADRLHVVARPRRTLLAYTVAALAIVVLSGLNVGSTLDDMRLIRAGIPRDDLPSPDAQPLLAIAEDLLQRRQSKRLLLRVIGLHHCGSPSGLIVGLTKAGYHVCLDPELARIFSPRHALQEPVDDMLIVCNNAVGRSLLHRQELRCLTQTPECTLFCGRPPGELRGRYGAEELRALATELVGFYQPEFEPDGRGFCWSKGAQSRIVVDLGPGQAYRIALAAAPLAIPQRNQRISVLFNGRPVANWAFAQPAWAHFAVTLPASDVQARNELVFRYAYVASPQDLWQLEDGRRLAVKLREITFEPAP